MTEPLRVRCRPVGDGDREALADLLAHGFPVRSLAYWTRALDRLAVHTTRHGYPGCGHVLEHDGRLVGALLTIYAGDRARGLRCNLSSWHVLDAFKAYAPLLVSRAVRDASVTYVNISPEPHTRPIIEAQGFAAYSRGAFIALPWLAPRSERAEVAWATGEAAPDSAPADERDLVRAHAGFGCPSLWCRAADGAHPFVFLERPAVKGVLPCLHLAYCRDVATFVRFSGSIGRFLARHGVPAVSLDANGPVPGLVGRYVPGQSPRYARGRHPPRLGDLAFTEAAMFSL